MNKEQARAMRTLLERHLNEPAFKEFLENAGMTVSLGNGRFTSTELTLKLNLTHVTEEGVVQTKDRVALEQHFPHLVDKRSHVRTKHGTVVGTVVEYNSRRHRYPFIVRTDAGQSFKVPHHSVSGPAVD